MLNAKTLNWEFIMKKGGTAIVIALGAVLLSQGCASMCAKKEMSSSPPHRDEVSPPPGHSRDGSAWKAVPENVASAVRSAAQKEGHNLQQYWDPMVKHEAGKWSFVFLGTMPDPGFSFTAVFDEKTQSVEIVPGA